MLTLPQGPASPAPLKVVQFARATLINGDAYEIPWRRFITARRQDVAIVTDPQYDFNASGGGHFRKSRHWMNDIVSAGLHRGFDPAILDPSVAANVVVFCHNDQLADLLPLLKTRFDRVVLLAWAKPNPVPFANHNHWADLEFIIHAWSKPSYPSGALADLSRVFHDQPPHKRSHPTQKPIAMMRRLIRILPSRLIIDPFMGAGTTGLAALIEGRFFAGAELDPLWFDAARQTIANKGANGLPAPSAPKGAALASSLTER